MPSYVNAVDLGAKPLSTLWKDSRLYVCADGDSWRMSLSSRGAVTIALSALYAGEPGDKGESICCINNGLFSDLVH